MHMEHVACQAMRMLIMTGKGKVKTQTTGQKKFQQFSLSLSKLTILISFFYFTDATLRRVSFYWHRISLLFLITCTAAELVTQKVCWNFNPIHPGYDDERCIVIISRNKRFKMCMILSSSKSNRYRFIMTHSLRWHIQFEIFTINSSNIVDGIERVFILKCNLRIHFIIYEDVFHAIRQLIISA